MLRVIHVHCYDDLIYILNTLKLCTSVVIYFSFKPVENVHVNDGMANFNSCSYSFLPSNGAVNPLGLTSMSSAEHWLALNHFIYSIDSTSDQNFSIESMIT